MESLRSGTPLVAVQCTGLTHLRKLAHLRACSSSGRGSQFIYDDLMSTMVNVSFMSPANRVGCATFRKVTTEGVKRILLFPGFGDRIIGTIELSA